jgi:phosphoserine aminotransferase
LTPTKKEGGTGSAFVYFCDNETVDGVEFPHFPACLEPQGGDEEDERIVVADMSSNFLSRHVDVHKYGVIFGGAQKNIGITDTTLLIVRKSLLDLTPPPAFLHALGVWSPPVIFNWAVLAKNNSLYNTIPIFGIFIAGEVMRESLAVHGALTTASQGNLSAKKAAMIYGILDANPTVYQVCPDRSVRSRMNICWRIKGGDEAAEKQFLAGAEQRGLQGLKGHRSVGGVRASNYNAVPLENVEKLATWMEDFVKLIEAGGPS